MSEKTHTDQNCPTKIHEDKRIHFSQGLRVLAIDDDIVCLRALECNLQKCGYKVSTTTDAMEAIEILRKNKEAYDIVITDVLRSEMDGFQVVEIIEHEIGIPVIMTSASDDVNIIEKGVKHGALDYLVKPIPVEILKNIWQHVIRKSMNCSKCVRKIEDVSANANKDDREGNDTQSTCSTGENENSQADSKKRPRVDWAGHLNDKFLDVVRRLEAQKIKVVPKVILKMMNEPSLTRQQVASHLQKHRLAADLQKKETIEEREMYRQVSQSNGYTSIPHPFGQNISPFATLYSQTGMYAQSQPPPHQKLRLSQCSYSNMITERIQSQRNSSHISIQKEILPQALNLARFGVSTTPNSSVAAIPNQQHNVAIQVAHKSNLVANGHQVVGDIESQRTTVLQHSNNVGPLSTNLPGSYEESKPLVIADPQTVDMGSQIQEPKEEVAVKSVGYIPPASDTANISFEFEEIGALVNSHPAPML